MIVHFREKSSDTELLDLLKSPEKCDELPTKKSTRIGIYRQVSKQQHFDLFLTVFIRFNFKNSDLFLDSIDCASNTADDFLGTHAVISYYATIATK